MKNCINDIDLEKLFGIVFIACVLGTCMTCNVISIIKETSPAISTVAK